MSKSQTMAKTHAKSVDEYIAAQPEAVQRALRRVRSAIREALPDADEVISYGMPAYRVNSRIAVYFAGWKEHYSIYPAGSAAVLTALKKELAPYEISKGTIRFPLPEPVPVKLIVRIARLRAKEVAAKKH